MHGRKDWAVSVLYSGDFRCRTTRKRKTRQSRRQTIASPHGAVDDRHLLAFDRNVTKGDRFRSHGTLNELPGIVNAEFLALDWRECAAFGVRWPKLASTGVCRGSVIAFVAGTNDPSITASGV